jgi:hypothetical protein
VQPGGTGAGVASLEADQTGKSKDPAKPPVTRQLSK